MNELASFWWKSSPQLIAALLGTTGFALVFKMKRNHLFLVSVGGLLTYGIYITMIFKGQTEFLSAFFAASFVALLSEILSRIEKAPTVIFLTTVSISIVPGSGLYYSMRNLLLRDIASFSKYFKSTCAVSAGMVFGIIFMSAMIKLLTVFIRKNNDFIHEKEKTQ